MYRAIFGTDGQIINWQSVTFLPTPLSLHAVATHSNKIYVIGGETSLNENSSSVFHTSINQDCSLSGWTEEVLPGQPRERIVAIGGNQGIYMVGGRKTDNFFTKDFYYYVFVEPPQGTLDIANCTQIAGWARDPNAPDPIYVHIYKDGPYGQGGTFITSTLANLYRSDLPFTDKNHGFSIITPTQLKTGQNQTIYAHAIVDGSGNPLLNGVPKIINCLTPSPSPTRSPSPTPSRSPSPTPSRSPSPSPTPSSSPSYTVTDLKNLLLNYLGIGDQQYYLKEGKINILDAGWVIRWLR